MHEEERINKRLCKFFIEIFEFTDEQLAAIDFQIPMTQEIYDSITSAQTNINDDGTMSYSGGTPYAEIEAKVGKPDTTSESSIGNQTIVTVNWTSISWLKGETQSITIQYDKATGQITSKSKFNS